MLADPQSITVNSVAQSMPRIEVGARRAVYRKNDGTYTLTISHSNASGNRVRSMARVDQVAVVQDPLTQVNDEETLSLYIVLDRPMQGFTSTQVDQLVTGFKAWLTTTVVSQLYGQEA
jgi:hypothetical protein